MSYRLQITNYKSSCVFFNTQLSILNTTLCFSALLLVAVLFTFPLRAQVTMGDVAAPHKFSVLELVSKTSAEGGLRLPQLSDADCDAIKTDLTTPGTVPQADIDAAKGLVVFNTDTNCLEFWNGSDWISLCGGTAAESTTTSAAAPVQPGAITGSKENLVFSAGPLTYSTGAVPGAESYTWTFPEGWKTKNGANVITTTSPTVTVSVSGTPGGKGSISVKANNAGGSSAASTVTVTYNKTQSK